MADEKTDDTSLSDTISAAFDEAEKVENEGENSEVVSDPEQAVENVEEPTQEEVTSPPEEEPTPEIEEPLEAPQHWSAQDKDVFSKAPRETQEWLLEKSKSLEKGYDEKFREVAAIKKAVEPWDNYLRSLGATPEQAINYLIGAEYQMRNGSADQKRTLLLKWAKDYGIDLTQAEMVEEDVDPTIKALRDELGQVKNVLSQQTQAQRQAQENAVLAEIDAFANQRTEAGDPAHPFFEDVLNEITERARIDLAQGRKPDLAKLYDAAVYANPDTRQRMLASQKEAEARKQAEAAKAKAAAAAKASPSVKGAPAGGSAPAQPKTLREQIEASYAEAS